MDIFGVLYPKKCVGCGVVGKYMCPICKSKIILFGQSLKYEGVVRKLIKEIKYRGSYDMVNELVEMWLDNNSALRKWEDDWIVTSVPMYTTKKKMRGYNQAEIIARSLAKRWNLEYRELLVRNRETTPMYGLSIDDRSNNVRGAFEINKSLGLIDVQRVILVDDVWTTGATMKECCKVLEKYGVKKVQIVAISR
ncbi:MAG: phosphoribosyltransferase family protein [bacterium]